MTEVWPDRPEPSEETGEYNPDRIFKESNDTWSTDPALLNKTGGKYKEIIVAIANFKIYFGSLS